MPLCCRRRQAVATGIIAPPRGLSLEPPQSAAGKRQLKSFTTTTSVA